MPSLVKHERRQALSSFGLTNLSERVRLAKIGIQANHYHDLQEIKHETQN